MRCCVLGAWDLPKLAVQAPSVHWGLRRPAPAGGTATEAFALLRRTSQDLNVKLTRHFVGRHTALHLPDIDWTRDATTR